MDRSVMRRSGHDHGRPTPGHAGPVARPASGRALLRRPGPSPGRAMRSARREEHCRLELDRADQRDNLGLATREVAARLVQERGISTERQPAVRAARPRSNPAFAVGLERERLAEVVLHGAFIERGPLVQVNHLPAIARNCVAADRLTVKVDRAGVERVEQRQCAQQHGLARTRWTENAQAVAKVDAECSRRESATLRSSGRGGRS